MMSFESLLAGIDAAEGDRLPYVRHLKASEEIWMRVLDERPDLNRLVASNKHLPAAVLSRLARCDDWRVRVDIAMKRLLPVELIEALAADPDEAVRAAIARHRSIPCALLKTLYLDPEIVVRNAASAALRLQQGS